jgi:uncharacterized protein (DUF58 family)
MNQLRTAKDSLSPEFIAQLKGLDIRARLVVEGFLAGLHRSPYHGFSVEFAEYRSYMPGDEIKRLDWKALARSDRYYVKQFEEETNLKAYILLDSSASMGYHGNSLTKHQYGTCLAAALSLLLLNQHDAVGLATFGPGLKSYLAPSSRRSHWRHLLEGMESDHPSGGTDFERVFSGLAGHLKRRGLIVLISDLWDGSDQVIRALKHFRHLKHEVLLFHLLDRDEVEWPFSGPACFRDLESGEEVRLDCRSAGEGYRMALEGWRARLARECRLSLIDYVPLDTAQPYDRALLSYLHKRQRLG